MTYTPINWQTGDTITAEKMNKMDNGWGVQETQLFSETVTTEVSEYGNEGQFAYSNVISSSEITVTFNGSDYTCQVINIGGSAFGYGGVDANWEYDFTDFPFAIVSSQTDGNVCATANAGTYQVAVSAAGVEASSEFLAAVGLASKVFIATSNVTTWQEIYDALAAGKDVRINSASENNVYSEPVYSATFDGTNYGVTAFYVYGGGTPARYYVAASASSAILPN